MGRVNIILLFFKQVGSNITQLTTIDKNLKFVSDPIFMSHVESSYVGKRLADLHENESTRLK